MKQAGIDYIRQLAHAFWTDYNEHDPGITALEQLCYALIDLGALPTRNQEADDAA